MMIMLNLLVERDSLDLSNVDVEKTETNHAYLLEKQIMKVLDINQHFSSVSFVYVFGNDGAIDVLDHHYSNLLQQGMGEPEAVLGQ